LEQTPTRHYRLGLRVLELGNLCRLRLNLAKESQEIVERLSQRAGANAHLAMLDGIEVFDIVRVENPAPLRIARTPMLRRPAHCTALGKVLLAFGDPQWTRAVLDQGLTRLTRKTITQPARLLAELERIRRAGYAIDNEEFYLGKRCLAAPVFDDLGRVKAALSVSCLITHLTEDRIERFARLAQGCAGEISERLGYQRKHQA
jgi:DNA-binding IclR family transcriptional regulator